LASTSHLAQLLAGAKNTNAGSEYQITLPSMRTPSATPKFLEQLFNSPQDEVPHFHEYRVLNPAYASYEPYKLRTMPTGYGLEDAF
jgi:hypothetical protein